MKKLLFLLIITHYSLLIATAQWVQVSNGMGNYQIVRSLVSSGNYIFAGTGSYHGIYRSTDNGTSWTQTTGLTNRFVLSLAVNGNNILAGTETAVYLSSNNGTNWIQTNLNNRIVWVLAVNGNKIYAGTDGLGVYLSTDNGTSWTQTSLNNRDVYSLAVNENIIFAGTGYNYAVYLSTDNGEFWTQTSLNNRDVYSLAINGNYIFAGTWGYGVYLSTNNGTTWTQTSLNSQYVYSLAVNGNNIFAGTYQNGVYISNDNGANWTQRNEGLGNATVYAFCILNNYIFAGTYNNGVYRRLLSELTGIQPISQQLPEHFALYQNYPNPFNPATTIKFDIPNSFPPLKGDRGMTVQLIIYDILGRELATLVNEPLKPGTYEVEWNASNYPSGVYFYSLSTGEFSETGKAVLMK